VYSQGAFIEEMVNNRKKSVVKDLKWRSDGSQICIAYEDGLVIVGTVDGARLWSKEFGTRLTHLEWSPDGNYIVFATAEGPLPVYNSKGVKVSNLTLPGLLPATADPATSPLPPGVHVVSIEWYDGAEGEPVPNCHSLAVALSNGRVWLLRGVEEDGGGEATPCLTLTTGLNPLTAARWNSNGTYLAVVGQKQLGGGKEVSECQFFTPAGKLVHSLRVPGGNVTTMAWEGGGLRVALALESFVFFASARPQYMWAAFENTIVYAFAKPNSPEHCCMFWNTKSGETHLKVIKNLTALTAGGDCCALFTLAEAEGDVAGTVGAPSAAPRYTLILCNSIGSPIESRPLSIAPMRLAMTSTHLAVASAGTLYLWNYRVPMGPGEGGGRVGSGSADSLSSGSSLRGSSAVGREEIFSVDSEGGASGDIVALAASVEVLLVAQEGGRVLCYKLAGLVLDKKFQLRPGCKPAEIAINCNSTQFSIIDTSAVLTIFDMKAQTIPASGPPTVGEHLGFERRDIWVSNSPSLFLSHILCSFCCLLFFFPPLLIPPVSL